MQGGQQTRWRLHPPLANCSCDHPVAALWPPPVRAAFGPLCSWLSRALPPSFSPPHSDRQPWGREPAAQQTMTSSLRAACGWVSAPGCLAPPGPPATWGGSCTMHSEPRPAAGHARVAGAARGQAARHSSAAGRPRSHLPGHQVRLLCCPGDVTGRWDAHRLAAAGELAQQCTARASSPLRTAPWWARVQGSVPRPRPHPPRHPQAARGCRGSSTSGGAARPGSGACAGAVAPRRRHAAQGGG